MKILLTLLLMAFSYNFLDAQTIYLVRHGEKADYEGVDLKNPPLSEKGLLRSYDLMDFFEPQNLDVVYVTNTIRSRQTAEQLILARSLKTVEYDPMPTMEWVKSIIDSKKNVLIVAHSNTIGHIYNLIEEVMNQTKTSVEHSEEVYDRVYTFQVKNPKKFRVTIEHYGSDLANL